MYIRHTRDYDFPFSTLIPVLIKTVYIDQNTEHKLTKHQIYSFSDRIQVGTDYCNGRNFRTRKNFVLLDPRPFIRYKFPYSKDSVTYIGIRAWFSYATKFRTLSLLFWYRFNFGASINNCLPKLDSNRYLYKYCNCRNFRTRKNFVLLRLPTFVP